MFTRDNGEADFVEQTKINGREVGYHTEHPDGTVHDYKIYEKMIDKSDYINYNGNITLQNFIIKGC